MSTFGRRTWIAAAGLSLASAAHAELGGAVSTRFANETRAIAATSAATMAGFTRHETVRANGGMVHEFTNGSGQVFAVSWSGPGKPDLRTLLGRYFDVTVASPAPSRALRTLRQPVQAGGAGVQIASSGHMGWFRGIAYVAALAPPGFTPTDLPPER